MKIEVLHLVQKALLPCPIVWNFRSALCRQLIKMCDCPQIFFRTIQLGQAREQANCASVFPAVTDPCHPLQEVTNTVLYLSRLQGFASSLNFHQFDGFGVASDDLSLQTSARYQFSLSWSEKVLLHLTTSEELGAASTRTSAPLLTYFFRKQVSFSTCCCERLSLALSKSSIWKDL